MIQIVINSRNYNNKYLLLKKIPTQFGVAVVFRHLMKEIKSYLWHHPPANIKIIKEEIDKLSIALNEVVHSKEPNRLLVHTAPHVYHDPNYLYSDKVETLFTNGLKILKDNPDILTYVTTHLSTMYNTLTTAIEQSKIEQIKKLSKELPLQRTEEDYNKMRAQIIQKQEQLR
jgi:hypothetical protein